MTDEASTNREVVRRLMTALDRRDIDGVVGECASEAVWYGFGPEPLDDTGYRTAIQQFLDGFPDSRFPVSAYVAEGERVAAVHALEGTHNGTFQGVAPTGKRVHVPAIVIFRLRQARVTETWLSADLLGLLMQIGAVPAPSPS